MTDTTPHDPIAKDTLQETEMEIETEVPEPPPLVIIEGFMGGFGTQTRWGDFQNHWHDDSAVEEEGVKRRRRAIFVSVGPVSSLHDRACEIFYALIGGPINYGEEHAAEHGHATHYGRTYTTGLYPQWSKEKPLHFLGHSFGGPTIIKLQYLIKAGFFGKQYSPDMILSVNTVSSPFRGTSIVYLLGMRVDAAPHVHDWSIGSAISKVAHLLSYFSPWTAPYIDFHTESRKYAYTDASIWRTLKLLWRSDWGESRDCAPFDVTFQAGDEREEVGEGRVNEKTFYRSYAASWSDMKKGAFQPPAADWWDEPIFWYCSFGMASFDFSRLFPIPSFVQTMGGSIKQGDEGAEVYFENDGVVPLFSQWHPYACKQTKCEHFEHGDITKVSKDASKAESRKLPEPGKWHVYKLENSHHGTIAPTWRDTPRQRGFWKELGQWLRDVDTAAGLHH